MSPTVRSALLLISLAPQAATAQGTGRPEAGLAALERAWHACVRDAFAQQPRTQSRAGSQRNALDACQAQEDAFVAAAMTEVDVRSREARAGEPARRPALTERARAWAASVASDVLDPVSSWFSALRR